MVPTNSPAALGHSVLERAQCGGGAEVVSDDGASSLCGTWSIGTKAAFR